LHKIFQTSGWLLVDKLARLFFGLITMAMIARHLGPEAFGIWSFAIALTTIAGGLAILGLDKVVVKELVSFPDKQDMILSTALVMRIAAGILSCLICIVIVGFTKSSLYLLCTGITGFNIVLQSFDVFDYFYQANNQVQKVIIPKVGVFVFFCAIKLLFILCNGSLVTFVWLSFVELFITYIIILVFYLNTTQVKLFAAFSMKEANRLMIHSWPLMFTGILVLLYMKSDQLMLDTFGNPVQLGEYAAAARISELWYAIPTVISTALLPGLVQKRQTDIQAYWKTIEKWLRFSFWISILIGIMMSFIAGKLTGVLYGDKYPHSGAILVIHVWANIPVFLCVVIMQYQIVEGAYKTNLYATVVGLIVNVVINILLIPSMGGIGAAISTVASYVSLCITVILMDKSGKVVTFTRQMLDPVAALADLKKVLGSFKIFTGSLLPIIREK
jgi:O-antigen/teichoic acid export membrane protein